MKTLDYRDLLQDQMMRENKIVACNKRLTKQLPTDEIMLSYNIHKHLLELVSLYKPNDPIPADILMSETIPIEDIRIISKITTTDIKDDEISDYIHQIGDFATVSTRILLYDDWKNRIDNFKKQTKEDKCKVGIAVFELDIESVDLYMEFGIVDLNNIDVFPKVGYRAYTKKGEDYLQKLINFGLVHMMTKEIIHEVLQLWYATEISLLHPVVKDVFKNTKPIAKTINTSTSSSKKSNKKSKIKYIKRHIIEEDSFDNFFEKSSKHGKINRKALIWHVAGHVRKQPTKDGYKTIFIEGYWKGALRHIKTGETREREIITE